MNNARRAAVAFFGLAGLVAAAFTANPLLFSLYQLTNRESRPVPLLSAIAFSLLGAILGGGLGNVVYFLVGRWAERWDKMDTGDKVTLFLGIFAGIVASLPFTVLFMAMGTIIAALVTFGLMLGFSAIAVYALNSIAEVLPWQKVKGKSRRSGIKILDTNVIIDGRIYDVARTGFLEGQLYVPKFVLEEVQYKADSSDALIRQRGRRGLEVLKHLQASFPIEVGIHDKLVSDPTAPVDARLVMLAKSLGADIVTNDYNLNSVAKLQNIQVLSLNDLAMAVKPNVLPKENLELILIREGNQTGQGVGYLDDGTMVVVENGRRHIGEKTRVTVTQVIQTERGKMIFAEVDGEEDPESPERYYRRPSRRAN